VLSLAELERTVRVLAPRLAGHRLQDVVQPDAQRIVLTSYGPKPEGGAGRLHVLLCCDAQTARLSLVEQPPRRLPRPPAFAQYLKAHALGARIARVDLLGGDRIVALDLEASEGALRLLLQIFGRRSNVYVVDARERLAAALRALEATRPELVLGEAWRAPASKPPRAGEDRFRDVPDDALFAAIEASCGAREAEGAHAALRRRLERVLHKETRRLDRKLEKLEAELQAARDATELARQGELLKASLSRVRRGDARIAVRDPETGGEVTIALDPAKSPAQNLEAIFKSYKKALRRLAKGGAQEEAVRDARRELGALNEGFAGSVDDPVALRAFADRPEVCALLRRYESAPGAGVARAPARREVRIGKHSLPRRLAPRRYPTADGLEIWVGRSDEANDFLTTRLARGKDLFFHLDGAPGSHVILRTEGREDPPSEAVLDACELAVHFSKLKKAPRADVHVVPIKNVRKPKGAKPGLVMVHGGKTVHLRRTPARLQRLLSSQVDEG
jgi:predicted ribosome quality control (RQC) complex YloA/Tae2 family protein